MRLILLPLLWVIFSFDVIAHEGEKDEHGCHEKNGILHCH